MHLDCTAAKPLIGMVHLAALPGSPKATASINTILQQACSEAKALETAGFHAILLENMHDIPYLRPPADPVVVASMAVIAKAVRETVSIPIGIQVLAAANQEALAIAMAANLQFIRAEGFVFGHVADEGYIDGGAGALLRYRKNIGAEHIAIWTDIKKKHAAHALTADVSIEETAQAAAFFLSDALILTGSATGHAASIPELRSIKSYCPLPVYIGSGIDLENLPDYYPWADGFIVGSSLKQDGIWSNPLEPGRLEKLSLCWKELARQ